jgi:hypothetical protein
MKALLAAAVLLTLLGCASDRKEPAESTEVAASVEAQQPPASERVFTVADEQGLRDQIERNWNLGSLAGASDLAGLVVELRIALLPDGTVTKIEVLNDRPGNATFQQVAESARRAVAISSPLKLPPGLDISDLTVRFRPDQVVQ